MSKILISGATTALNQLRYETAEELGMNNELQKGWNKMSVESRTEIGRNMSRKLFKKGLEEYIKQKNS